MTGVPPWLGEQLQNPVWNCTGGLGAPQLVICNVGRLIRVPARFAQKVMFGREC